MKLQCHDMKSTALTRKSIAFVFANALLFFPSFASAAEQIISQHSLTYGEDNRYYFKGALFTGIAADQCLYVHQKWAEEKGYTVGWNEKDKSFWLYENDAPISPLSDSCTSDSIQEISYQNGLRHGAFVLRRIDGKLKATGSYQNGLQVGRWVTYYDNGNVKYDVTKIDGENDGLYKVYHQNGALAHVQTWVAGKGLHGPWEFFDPCGKGKKIATVRYSNLLPVEVQYGGKSIDCGKGWSDYSSKCRDTIWDLKKLVGFSGNSSKARCKAGDYYLPDGTFASSNWLERLLGRKLF